MGWLDRFRGALGRDDERDDERAGAVEIERALGAYELGRTELAEAICERVLGRDPRDARALHLLGLIAYGRRDHSRAAALIESAIAADPADGLYHFNLGNALRELGRLEEATASYAHATTLDPDRVAAWFNLAQLHVERGEPEQAISAFREAIRLEPASPQARAGLATALVDTAQAGAHTAARSAEALALLENDWPRAPNPRRARFVVAMALVGCGRWTEAAGHLEALVAERPDSAQTRNALANCYNRLGRVSDAVREYREAFRAAPAFHEALTAVLGTLNAAPQAPPEEVFAAHCEWAAAVAAPLYPAAPRFGNARDRNRRLRIGYVSPDLRRHPVGTMFAPVLERHDPQRVETFCYYNFRGADLMTGRMRRAAHHWRDIAELDDATVADAIRADAIDVLVDLAGHTRHTRLLVFARRPAPVQASWLGYFNTTGLATMDYFLTDPVSSPPGQERYFLERLVRLPATRFCYEPPDFLPEVNALPAHSRGHVTFGCLNALAKVNDRVLALWARILAGVPGARLLLQAAALDDPLVRRDFRARAGAHGIAAERLELRPFVPVERAAHAYHDVDIALDPFPFCGGMTSLEALWMGVPVVTLPQIMIAGRQSASMLANLGLPELIAADETAYVGAAAALAGDLDRLAALRAGLRERCRRSPLADYARFTRDLEQAFAAMWEAWLAATPGAD
ncbi:MAG TPA: tetratricopeptide repeat protein [Burkholderiales bacterium]|nr:tetratricopeptide repeat protein [Burkholderiales bacterium]